MSQKYTSQKYIGYLVTIGTIGIPHNQPRRRSHLYKPLEGIFGIVIDPPQTEKKWERSKPINDVAAVWVDWLNGDCGWVPFSELTIISKP